MFKCIVEPRFGDCDGLKHVNNIVIGEWFELGRNPIFRMFTYDLDFSYDKWKLIMLRTEFDFVGQMFFGFNVEIHTYVLRIGNSSFTLYHEAWQEGELKAKGKAIIVHFDFINQKSVPIPDEIKVQLEEHMFDEEELV